MLQSLDGWMPSVHEDLALSDVRHYELLSSLLDWWQRTGDGPRPAHIDPLDLDPRVLPNLILLDLLDDRTIRVRLAGTFVEGIYGRALKGMDLCDLFDGSDAERVQDDVVRVANEGSPLLTARSYLARTGRVRAYGRLLLPIGAVSPSPRIVKAIEVENWRARSLVDGDVARAWTRKAPPSGDR